ncbi:MAG: glutamate-1-semialdehyde-2,1-aminomutase [Actinobacteria bacterium]|nr:MAG: glutamate-1-semialdehyde-2,1-aminomutase [Actinomycetota bacterium]
MRAGRQRGRGRADDQAGVALSRRAACGTRTLRAAARRLQRLRGIRDGQGRGREGIPRRAPGRARIADCDQAGRRRLRDLVLDEGARHLALRTRSDLYRRALELIPGGVNSPVRAMRAVGLDEPFFVRHGDGAYIEDVSGNRYLDWVMSWGPLLFGHADPQTVEAVRAAAERGTSFGAPTEAEVELAAEIVDAVPSVEKVRLVSSGTEAAMSAVRLARAFTSRDRVLKFAGCYHGHVDALLANAGSGVATLGLPSSPGVPTAVTSHTIVCKFNDVDAIASTVAEFGEGLAAIIVEPVAGNMGVVPAEPDFLGALRRLCDASGALLVFDEVITGFRVARGGAQQRFGVLPDLTILGKIVGGGLPLAAFGGRAEIMDRLAPSGDVYQAGTLSGNPLATAAGLAVLRRLRDPEVYRALEERGARLEAGLASHGRLQRVGAMATLFMTDDPVRNFDDAQRCDTERYGALFRHLLDRGIYVAPSQFEAMFLSLAHGDEEIDRTIEAVGSFG